MSRALWLVFVCCGRTEPVQFDLTPHQTSFDAAVRDAGLDGGRPDAGLDAGRPDAGLDAGRPDAGLDTGRPDAGIATSCQGGTSRPISVMPCSWPVRLTRLNRSMATCFIDVRADIGDLGTLRWDCDRDAGFAELEFPRMRFLGTVSENQLDLCLGSTFDWSDGCRWTSAQRVFGSFRPGGQLSFTYGEAPVPGSVGCVVPCTATGMLEILAP